MFDMSRETDSGITLYSRKVMIMTRANNILPKWMRFIKGKVVITVMRRRRVVVVVMMMMTTTTVMMTLMIMGN